MKKKKVFLIDFFNKESLKHYCLGLFFVFIAIKNKERSKNIKRSLYFFVILGDKLAETDKYKIYHFPKHNLFINAQTKIKFILGKNKSLVSKKQVFSK